MMHPSRHVHDSVWRSLSFLTELCVPSLLPSLQRHRLPPVKTSSGSQAMARAEEGQLEVLSHTLSLSAMALLGQG